MGGPRLPVSGSTGAGRPRRPGSAAAPGREPAQEAQSLFRDPTAFSLGPETSGKGALGTARDTGFQGAGDKDTGRVPCSQPLAPGGTAALRPSLHTGHLLTHACCAVGHVAAGGPAGSSALANYCDVSAPRPGPSLDGLSRTTVPPRPQPEPAPPLAVVAASSDHSNRFPGPDRVP